MKDLKKHKVNVDNLSPLELDEIADIIADAIQVVDVEKEKENGVGKVEEARTEAEVKEVDAQGGTRKDANVSIQGTRPKS